MHHSYEALDAAAKKVNEHGPRQVEIALEAGDTAWAPGTTKYDLLGHGKGGTVTYFFFTEGVEASTQGQVSRCLIDNR